MHQHPVPRDCTGGYFRSKYPYRSADLCRYLRKLPKHWQRQGGYRLDVLCRVTDSSRSDDHLDLLGPAALQRPVVVLQATRLGWTLLLLAAGSKSGKFGCTGIILLESSGTWARPDICCRHGNTAGVYSDLYDCRVCRLAEPRMQKEI